MRKKNNPTSLKRTFFRASKRANNRRGEECLRVKEQSVVFNHVIRAVWERLGCNGAFSVLNLPEEIIAQIAQISKAGSGGGGWEMGRGVVNLRPKGFKNVPAATGKNETPILKPPHLARQRQPTERFEATWWWWGEKKIMKMKHCFSTRVSLESRGLNKVTRHQPGSHPGAISVNFSIVPAPPQHAAVEPIAPPLWPAALEWRAH